MSAKTIIHRSLLVTCVFLFTQLAMAAVLRYMGYAYFNTFNWLRADSGHYLAIAREGYEFMPCSEVPGFGENSPFWCGNTGWFPGYPYLIRGLASIFGNPELLAGIISKLFFMGCLWMALAVAGITRFTLKSFSWLCLAGLAFGNIYYFAIFPISATLFFSLCAFYFLLKKQVWPSAIAAFTTSFLYPTGFLLAVVLSLFILLQTGYSRRQRMLKILILLSSGFLAVALFFTILHFEVGVWDAFIKVQHKYGHGVHNPITNIYHHLAKFSIANLQSAIVLLGYVIATIFFFLRKLYREPLSLLTFIYLTVYLLFPWTVGGNLSMYRAEALLLPFVFLLRDVSFKYVLLILLVLMAVSLPMAYLFFDTTLV